MTRTYTRTKSPGVCIRCGHTFQVLALHVCHAPEPRVELSLERRLAVCLHFLRRADEAALVSPKAHLAALTCAMNTARVLVAAIEVRMAEVWVEGESL